jgi:DNA-binding winged helix-turn-helix (wHTH) protein
LYRGRVLVAQLSPQQALVLEFLVRNVPNPVPIETIEAQLWKYKKPLNSAQRVRDIIKMLREVMEDSAARASWIETIPGTGYLFVGTVAYDERASGAFIPVSSPELSNPSPGIATVNNGHESALPIEGGDLLLEDTHYPAASASLRWKSFRKGGYGPTSLFGLTAALAATWVAAYGIAIIVLVVSCLCVAAWYATRDKTVTARAAVAAMLLGTMAFIPSAATLTETMAT